MAKLIVTALSEDALAAPGNWEPTYIIVSVTDVNGEPVTGLEESNFQVDEMIGGPGCGPVFIREFNRKLHGFYCPSVEPVRPTPWKNGVYIFSVVVENRVDKGQTLTTVQMD